MFDLYFGVNVEFHLKFILMFLFTMALTWWRLGDVFVLPTHAGPDLHCGDQQQPVAREGHSLAAELQRRASRHHKPDDEEAGIARNLK